MDNRTIEQIRDNETRLIDEIIILKNKFKKLIEAIDIDKEFTKSVIKLINEEEKKKDLLSHIKYDDSLLNILNDKM